MRFWIAAAALLAATGAQAQKASPRTEAAAAAAKALLDQVDQAYDHGDARALIALLDKGFFGTGPFVSSRWIDLDSAKTELVKAVGHGHLLREGLTLRVDDSGNEAWFLAEYTYVPKVPSGAMPLRRKVRATGAMVKRGGVFRLAMWSQSYALPDPPVTKPGAAAPVPAGPM